MLDLKTIILLFLPFVILSFVITIMMDDGEYKPRGRKFSLPIFLYESKILPYYEEEKRLNKISEINKILKKLKKEKKYKAFAASIKSNYSYAYGFSFNKKSKKEAERIALKNCEKEKKKWENTRPCKIYKARIMTLYKLKEIF